MNFTTTK